jgi:hypothetical protein
MPENKQSEATKDSWVWFWVIIFLGVAMLISLLGAIVLAGTKNSTIPEVVIAIGSAAVGALAGILVPTPTSKPTATAEKEGGVKIKEATVETKAAEVTPKAGKKPTIKIPGEIERWVYRAIVVFLGVATLLTLLGAIVLAAIGKTNLIPDGIVAIGSAAVGALAGVLSPSPLGR